MTKITFQNESVNITGLFPEIGTLAPNFTLCGSDLCDIQLNELQGKKVILSIFPSVDTPICALGVKKFNDLAAGLDNTVILCVSADLPFAINRFCSSKNLDKVRGGSFFRAPKFLEMYGVKIAEGPLEGLAARAIIVLDESGLVVYSELVSEITDEPNYDAAIKAVQ